MNTQLQLSYPQCLYFDFFFTQTDSGQAKKLHCGHLYKRGHLLRQWKARWFVLDTQRNQVLTLYGHTQWVYPQTCVP